MQQQGQSGGHEHAKQLRAVASAKAAQAVWDIVEGFGGQTVRPVRSRSLTWPGVNGVEPEPIACLEAARDLERAGARRATGLHPPGPGVRTHLV